MEVREVLTRDRRETIMGSVVRQRGLYLKYEDIHHPLGTCKQEVWVEGVYRATFFAGALPPGVEELVRRTGAEVLSCQQTRSLVILV